MQNINELIITTCNVVMAISSFVLTIFGFYSFRKALRFNLINIEITITEDTCKDFNLWFLKFRIRKINRPIDSMCFIVKKNDIQYLGYWDKNKFEPQSKDTDKIFLSGLLNEAYRILCFKIKREISDNYLQIIENNNSIDELFAFNSAPFKLLTESFNYSQLHLYAENQSDKSN